MNQLNLLQEKFQSNVISQEEQIALKGKRGKVFRGGLGDTNDVSNVYSSTTKTLPAETSSSGMATASSASSSSNVTITKFGTSKII